MVLVTATMAAGNPTRQALLVGVGRYAHRAVPDLNAPPHDLELIEALLIAQYGFTPPEITTLRDGQATRAAVVQYLANLAHSLQQRRQRLSDFLFYFSGHGDQVYDVNHDEREDFDDEVIVLAGWDGKSERLTRDGLLDDDLYASLTKIPADRRWVLLDCCYAGGGARPLEEEESDEGLPKTVAVGNGRRGFRISDFGVWSPESGKSAIRNPQSAIGERTPCRSLGRRGQRPSRARWPGLHFGRPGPRPALPGGLAA
jgi:hypothetical protein